MASQKRAAVFLLFGQSNAVGHRLPMREEDKIITPLRNVFGLHRDENQSYDSVELVFRGYTSAGMNLGETQDDTYSVANCLAAMWQAEKDAGNEDLPDLYIVHIAIGGQGVSKRFLWYPYREEKPMIPGKIGTVRINLFLLAKHVLSLLDPYFKARGIEPTYLHHWRGGEEEDGVPIERLGNLKPLYDVLLDGLWEAMGRKIPTVLHLMPLGVKEDFPAVVRERIAYINRTFENLAEDRDEISLFDPLDAPHLDRSKPYGGILMGDGVHFTEETNRWVASRVMDQLR